VKVVMTLLVRDEEDVLDEHLRYHLEHGVDFVVATDHRSRDGSTEILRRYEREGQLRLLHETADALQQAEWVTRMARLAATDFGADWVINSDADEFWWPREGSLREVLEAVPARFGAVRGLWRHFAPRPEHAERFHERMTVRRRSSDDFTSPYHPQVKVVHRGVPDVVVSQGNHDAVGRGLVLLREWFPFEVLHFPIRSLEQMQRKFLAWRALESGVPRHTQAGLQAVEERSGEDVFRRYLIDDEALAAGLAHGGLAIDTRLRDALRGSAAPASPALTARDDASYAEEVDALQETDSAVKLFERVDAFEGRLAAVASSGVVAPLGLLRRAAHAAGRR
jgi:Glycosyl transferase family 2